MKHVPIALLTLFFVCCFPAINFAQEEDPIFAYVNNTRSSRFAPKPVENYKWDVANRVFKDLVDARGEFKNPPSFEMNTGRKYVAWMNPIKKRIGVEERAYDLCISFGKDSLNALATLIAHEIIHYYEDHNWSRHFINANKNLDVSDEMLDNQQGRDNEVEADYKGGMLALAAGYNTFGIAEELLKKAYETYKLKEDLEGYPSLKERIIMSENSEKKLRKLHSVFEMANMMTLVGSHETANYYYQYILTDFQSYEMLNNAGVNAGLAALSLMKKGAVPFVLPFEIDQTSRLDILNTKGSQDPEVRIEKLLNDAEHYLKSAIEMDENKPMALINLSLIYGLQKNWFDAKYMSDKALFLNQSYQDPITKANAQIAAGILAGLQGDKSTAKQRFIEAKTGNKSLAEMNLQLLNEPNQSESLRNEEPAFDVEMIDELFLDDFLADPEVHVLAELTKNRYCGKTDYKNSEIFLDYAFGGKIYTLIQRTKPGYKGKTLLGAQLGDPKSKILELYKIPGREIRLGKENCLIYSKKKIFFIFDKQDNLREWAVFGSSELP